MLLVGYCNSLNYQYC